MKLLTFIPARRDSKGIPGKNWKMLGNKPLISWSIDLAKEFSAKSDICVSTNSPEVLEIVEKSGLPIYFSRPEELAGDTASTRSAVLHAIDFLEKEWNKTFDAVLILQPTNPFRKLDYLKRAVDLYQSESCDMVVSVYESPLNPYYNVYSEDKQGFIHRAIKSDYTRRQDCPKTWVINGNIYVININQLRQQEVHDFEKVVKMEMPIKYSVDLDTLDDWQHAEYLLEKRILDL